MNPNESREPISTQEGQEGNERVEVLVEDLFIEQYPPPGVPEQAQAEGGPLARPSRPMKVGKSVLYGLFILGALAIANVVLGGRSRRSSRIARMFHRIGLSI